MFFWIDKPNELAPSSPVDVDAAPEGFDQTQGVVCMLGFSFTKQIFNHVSVVLITGKREALYSNLLTISFLRGTNKKVITSQHGLLTS